MNGRSFRNPVTGGVRLRLGAGLVFLFGVAAAAFALRGDRNGWQVSLRPTLEDRDASGDLYTPSTQSLTRGHHWLEGVAQARISRNGDDVASFVLDHPRDDERLSLENVPLAHLVPALHYPQAGPPDEFDAYNLMMAEYSRNGLSLPVGEPGDSMAHFRTSLDESVPWTLGGPYELSPQPRTRPLRMSVVNNCLAPGLWEVAAADRAGEIYHAWFDLPLDLYYPLVARVNGVPVPFVKQALAWNSRPARADLDRLRSVERSLGRVAVQLVDRAVGYSTQDSRRKLQKGYVVVGPEGGARRPESLSEMVSQPVRMSDFVPPGKYSATTRKVFDVSFLGRPVSAEVRTVRPKTRYLRGAGHESPDFSDEEHLEFDVDLGGRRLTVGNLPLRLLVEQEEYAVHGFGVGILPAQTPAEQRRLFLARGPHPAYAYVLEEKDGALVALNSHELGVEQVFVRARPFADVPHWELIVASFERIADLAVYRIEMPAALVDKAKRFTRTYTTPIYYTYVDDNLS